LAFGRGIAPSPSSLLTAEDRLALGLALGPDDDLERRWRAWRGRVALNDIGIAAYRLLPAILTRALAHDIEDSELPRLKGVIRHTWLANQLRSRALAEALRLLEQARIDVLILKGAALFARYPQLITMRGAGDYDLLVRRRDAPRAAEVLLAAGFRPQVIRIDRFEPADFDSIHGVHLVKSGHNDSLDLHWRPLPTMAGEALVEEMFARSEACAFGGVDVRVPALADHLALAVARGATQQPGEFALRTAEAAFLLEACHGALDWTLFVDLTKRLGCRSVAREMIEFIRHELQIAVPDHAADRLGGGRGVGALLRIAQCLLVTPISSAVQSGERAWKSCGQWMRRTRAGRFAPVAALRDRALDRIWVRAARQAGRGDGPGIVFVTGFSFPEEEGRWTNGRLAITRLAIDPSNEHVDLRVTAKPFYPPGAEGFAFEVHAGPGSACRHVLRPSDGFPAQFIIAGASVLPSRCVLLVWRLLDAGSPSIYGLSDDPRALGLFVSRIDVMSKGAILESFEIGAPPIEAVAAD
jgi:hypothetical protein